MRWLGWGWEKEMARLQREVFPTPSASAVLRLPTLGHPRLYG